MPTVSDERLKEIEARAKQAVKALEVGGMAGAFLCVQPLAEDIPALLSALSARDATIRELREALEREREECAKVADAYGAEFPLSAKYAAPEIAAAIRARSGQTTEKDNG